MRDGLGKLLQEADAEAAPVRPAEGLAKRVLQRRRRERARRRVALGAAACAAVVLAGLWMNGQRPAESESIPVVRDVVDDMQPVKTLAEVKAELEAIKAQAERVRDRVSKYTATRKRLAARRAKRRRLAELEQRRLRLGDPLENVRKQAEKAAETMVTGADYRCQKLDQCAAAKKEYQRVIDLFPQTSWADVARQRLAEIGAV